MRIRCQMPGRWPTALKHRPPADDQFHRLAKIPGRSGGQYGMRPGKQFAAEARAEEFGDYADVFRRHAEHLGQDVAMVDDACVAS